MEEHECRRILEVPPTASMEDITQAYQLMKRIHEREQAVFTAPSMDEFSPEAREEVLEAIEAAYRELSRIHAEARPRMLPAPLALLQGDLPIGGETLRRIREGAGLSLEQVASRIHVRAECLSALEDERFQDLPPAAVNVRGFLTAYATEIGIPLEEVVPAYMQRFQRWQTQRVQ